MSIAFFGLLVLGIILIIQKDTSTESRKGTRTLGLIFILVSVGAGLLRLYTERRLGGGVSCFNDPSNPNCRVKSTSYNAFETLLRAFWMDWLAQSFAKARFYKKT